MSREALIEELRNYGDRHTEEISVVERFVTFVSAHPDCFERTLPVGHITGSGWVMNAAGTHVLLTHHRKLGIWLQLGGHVDGSSDVLGAALREVEEESGLMDVLPMTREIFDIDIHPVPAFGDMPRHLHYDVRYLFQASGGHDYVVSEESHDLRWVPIGDIRRFTVEPSMLRMVEKWLAIKGRLDAFAARADVAVQRLDAAEQRCLETNYAAEPLGELGTLIDLFLEDEGMRFEGCGLRAGVLNRLVALLANPRLRVFVWEKICRLAAQTADEDDGLRISLTIAIFELLAKRPEVADSLELLFSLASDPKTRWAVFAAYENFPDQLAEDRRRFGNGAITEEDYRKWRKRQIDPPAD